MFDRQMFINMKIQWAFTLLGCLAAALLPVPVLLYFYGPKLREMSKFAPTFSAPVAPSDSETEVGDDLEADKEKESASRSDA